MILFTDLDGTLLNSEKKLSARNYAALERAAALGIQIVPCTGRLLCALPEAVRSALDAYVGNGGVLIREPSGVPEGHCYWEDGGETILLTHDCTLPRPYSRGGVIRGMGRCEACGARGSSPFSAAAAYAYEPPVRQLIRGFKFHGVYRMEDWMADEMLRACKAAGFPRCVVECARAGIRGRTAS